MRPRIGTSWATVNHIVALPHEGAVDGSLVLRGEGSLPVHVQPRGRGDRAETGGCLGRHDRGHVVRVAVRRNVDHRGQPLLAFGLRSGHRGSCPRCSATGPPRSCRRPPPTRRRQRCRPPPGRRGPRPRARFPGLRATGPRHPPPPEKTSPPHGTASAPHLGSEAISLGVIVVELPNHAGHNRSFGTRSVSVHSTSCGMFSGHVSTMVTVAPGSADTMASLAA